MGKWGNRTEKGKNVRENGRGGNRTENGSNVTD